MRKLPVIDLDRLPSKMPAANWRELQNVTNSELECFDKCRAKHGYAYHELLRPKEEAQPLRRGRLGHRGIRAGWLGVAENGGTWEDAVEYARYELSRLEADDEEMRIAMDCCVRYFKFRREDICENVIPLMIESAFSVWLPTNGHRWSGVVYQGAVDLALLDVAEREIRIEDHKFSKLGVAQMERRLSVSTQLTGYLYGLRTMLRIKEHPFWKTQLVVQAIERVGVEAIAGARVGLVGYNVIKPMVPRVPDINKNGAVSVKKISTTSEIYSEALSKQLIEREIQVTDAQRELLAELRHKEWVGQCSIYRDDSEIARWIVEVREKAKQIRESGRNQVLRTRSDCTGPAQPACPFEAVCIDPASEETRKSVYRVAMSRHEELAEVQAEESTDGNESEFGW